MSLGLRNQNYLQNREELQTDTVSYVNYIIVIVFFFFHSSENFPCVQSLEYFVLSFFFKSVRNDEKMRLRQFFLVG